MDLPLSEAATLCLRNIGAPAVAAASANHINSTAPVISAATARIPRFGEQQLQQQQQQQQQQQPIAQVGVHKAMGMVWGGSVIDRFKNGDEASASVKKG